MTELAPFLGLLAGIVGVADTIPYVRDILRGTTRPHRGTWLIWGALAVVAVLSQRADGASWSLVMAATQAVLTAVIFALSITVQNLAAADNVAARGELVGALGEGFADSLDVVGI